MGIPRLLGILLQRVPWKGFLSTEPEVSQCPQLFLCSWGLATGIHCLYILRIRRVGGGEKGTKERKEGLIGEEAKAEGRESKINTERLL